MDRIKRNIDIIIILVVGFALRFTISFTHTYSNDELSAITRLEFDNFSELLETGVKTGDMHPAGVQIFMKAWSQIAGTSEIGMRFPFVIFGCISIWIVFAFGKKYLNRNAGLIAAACLALLYFPIMNSEFARPYSPGLMFCLLAGWYYTRLIFDKEPKYKDAIFMGLAMAGAMYTHYFAFMFVGFMGVSGLIFIRKHNLKQVILAGGIALLLFAPHYSITDYHLSVGGLQWLGPPGAGWLFEFLFHAFNESWIVVLGILVAIGLSYFFRDRLHVQQKKFIFIAALWFFGIYLVGHVYSVMPKGTPVLKYPVMLFALPFFLLLIGALLSRFKYQPALLAGLMLLLGVSTIRGKDLFGNMHYELFKEVSDDILVWEDLYGKDNIYTVYNINNPKYMNFYANQDEREIEFDWHEINYGDAGAIYDDLLLRTENYCIVGFSARHTVTQVYETCKEFYPHILEYRKYNNASVFLLSRWTPPRVEQEEEFLSYFNPMETMEDWEYDPMQVQYLEEDSTNVFGASYVLNELNPYGPNYILVPETIEDYREKYVFVEADIQQLKDLQLTISVTATRGGVPVEDRGEVWWYGRDLEQMVNNSRHGIFSFAFPDFIEPTDELKISFWNRNPSVPAKIGSIKIFAKENIWN